MKLYIILMFLIPTIESAAGLLETQDANSTGLDDEVARVLRSAAAGLRKYLEQKG